MDTYYSNRDCRCTRCRARSIMGPVMLITLGVLFLLDNLDVRNFDFHHTWPVILLVIGLVKIFQSNAPTYGHIVPAGPGTPTPPTQPPSGEVRNG